MKICPLFFILFLSIFQVQSQNYIAHDLVSSYCSELIPSPADTMFYNFSGDTLNIQLIRWGHACQESQSSIQLFTDTLKYTILDTSVVFCLADCPYWYNFKLYGMNDSSYVLNIDNRNYHIDRYFPSRYPYFAPIGAKWYYSSSANGRAPARSEYYLYESVKDTIIDAQSCKKLEITYYRYQGDSITQNPMYIYSLEDQVFYYNPHYQRFLKLYDFSASAGDTLEFYSPDTNLIFTTNDSTFQIVIDSISLVPGNSEMLNFYHSSYNPFEKWSYYGGYIEKIGSTYMMLPRSTTQIPEADGPLRCYVYGNFTKNFTNLPCDYRIVGLEENTEGKNIAIFPNPISTFAQIKFEPEVEVLEINLYNNLGQLVKEFEPTEGKLNFSKIQAGTYILELKTKNGNFTKKVSIR